MTRTGSIHARLDSGMVEGRSLQNHANNLPSQAMN